MPGSQARQGHKQTKPCDPLAVQNGSLILKTAVKTISTSTSSPAPRDAIARHPRGEQADHIAELEKKASNAIRAAARRLKKLASQTRTQPKRAATKRASSKPTGRVTGDAPVIPTRAIPAVVQTSHDDEDASSRAQAPDQATLATQIAALEHDHARLLATNQRLTKTNQHLALANQDLATRKHTLDAQIPGLIHANTNLSSAIEALRTEAAHLQTHVSSVWDFLATFDTPAAPPGEHERKLDLVLDFLAHGRAMAWRRKGSWKGVFEDAREWQESGGARAAGRGSERWIKEGEGR